MFIITYDETNIDIHRLYILVHSNGTRDCMYIIQTGYNGFLLVYHNIIYHKSIRQYNMYNVPYFHTFIRIFSHLWRNFQTDGRDQVSTIHIGFSRVQISNIVFSRVQDKYFVCFCSQQVHKVYKFQMKLETSFQRVIQGFLGCRFRILCFQEFIINISLVFDYNKFIKQTNFNIRRCLFNVIMSVSTFHA